jgi:Na+(H+)/acetate symporter ActP
MRQKRPNLFFKILPALFNWLLVVLQVLFVDPVSVQNLFIPSAYLTLFIPLFLALFFTSSCLLNKRLSLMMALGIVVFFYLRLWSLGTMLNLLLIASLVIALEYYFRSNPPPDKP